MLWEYKTIKLQTKGLLGGKFDENRLDEYMNQLGSQGWELVTSFVTSQEIGASRDVAVIFKRVKSSE